MQKQKLYFLLTVKQLKIYIDLTNFSQCCNFSTISCRISSFFSFAAFYCATTTCQYLYATLTAVSPYL